MAAYTPVARVLQSRRLWLHPADSHCQQPSPTFERLISTRHARVDVSLHWLQRSAGLVQTLVEGYVEPVAAANDTEFARVTVNAGAAAVVALPVSAANCDRLFTLLIFWIMKRVSAHKGRVSSTEPGWSRLGRTPLR